MPRNYKKRKVGTKRKPPKKKKKASSYASPFGVRPMLTTNLPFTLEQRRNMVSVMDLTAKDWLSNLVALLDMDDADRVGVWFNDNFGERISVEIQVVNREIPRQIM